MKRIAVALTSAFMLLGTGTVSFVTMVSWETVAQARVSLFRHSIPCWTEGDNYGDCRYLNCAYCETMQGTPRGSSYNNICYSH